MLKVSGFQNSRNNWAVGVLSISISLFWLMAKNLNVYYFALTGAIAEILWLPALALTFLLPLLCIVLLWKDRFNLRSLALYSALLSIVTILLLVTSGK